MFYYINNVYNVYPHAERRKKQSKNVVKVMLKFTMNYLLPQIKCKTYFIKTGD
jgi:hypothetical protein